MKRTTKSSSKSRRFPAKLSFLPVCEPLFNGSELCYVQDAVRSGWISSQGDYLKKFESGFASYVGVSHGIATTSGTTALHLALAALEVGPGDEVIVPDFTMIACAFAVCQTGAKPIFVDAEPETWNMDVNKVEAKLTPRTKVIMAVHIYGHPLDMEPLLALARRKGIKVLEDAAEAHGALYKGKQAGSLADIAAFSFYANKIVTTGEGGMVVTSDDALAKRCRKLKNLCFPLDGTRRYSHDELGFNYRMSNLHAAIGFAQLERVEKLVAARRKMAHRYIAALTSEDRLQLPVERPWVRNVYWMFGVVLKPFVKRTRDEVMARLHEQGVDSRAFFQPMHSQPALATAGCGDRGPFPVSDRLASRGLYLPSTGDLSEKSVQRVAEALRKALD